MSERFAPSQEELQALANDTKTRMNGRARSWLQDSKVKKALSRIAQETRENCKPLSEAC